PASNRSTIPVWKVYMEAGRVVVINISGFVYPHAQEQRSFGLGPGLGAGATQSEVTSELGPPEHVQEDHTGNIELTYLARGVRFVLVEQSGESEPGVTNITLFGPLWGSEADRVLSTLSTAR
ncbi:MAG: hypothetical protein QGG40_18170, partial [Myxococcota bacterium]|nr:hypothetical protein [Myxococcota bacterium]